MAKGDSKIYIASLPTFSLQDESIEMMERQIVCTERAGDQSSVNILRQICPLEYMCGWMGMLSPTKIT